MPAARPLSPSLRLSRHIRAGAKGLSPAPGGFAPLRIWPIPTRGAVGCLRVPRRRGRHTGWHTHRDTWGHPNLPSPAATQGNPQLVRGLPEKNPPPSPNKMPWAGSGPRGMVGATPAFPGLAEAARPPQPPQPTGDPVPIPPTSEGTRGRGRPTCAGPRGCPGLGWGVLQSLGEGGVRLPTPPLHRHRATVPRQSLCAGFACRLPHVAQLSRRTKPLRLAAPAGS